MQDSDVATEIARVRELSKPSVFRWGLRVAINWTEIAALFVAMHHFHHPVVYIVGILCLATRQHALSIMLHDATHYAVCRNHRWNDFIGALFSFWPMGMGVHAYRKFHFEHHRTSGTQADPELTHKRWASPEFSTPLRPANLLRFVLKDMAGFAAREIFRLTQLIRPQTLSDRIGPAWWWTFALAALYHFGQLWVAGVWFFTELSSYWAVFRLRIWTEHVGTAGTRRFHANPLTRFFITPHNTWCHYEHHRWPSIPCWNLPRARPLDTDEPVTTVVELWRQLKSAPITEYGLPVAEQPAESGFTEQRRAA